MIYYPAEQMERSDQKEKKEWETVGKQLISKHVRLGWSLTAPPQCVRVYKSGLMRKDLLA